MPIRAAAACEGLDAAERSNAATVGRRWRKRTGSVLGRVPQDRRPLPVLRQRRGGGGHRAGLQAAGAGQDRDDAVAGQGLGGEAGVAPPPDCG